MSVCGQGGGLDASRIPTLLYIYSFHQFHRCKFVSVNLGATSSKTRRKAMESTLNIGAQSSAKTDEEKMRYDRRAKLKQLNLNPKNQGP
jgi:hypothetical protein